MQIGRLNQVSLAAFIGGRASLVQNQSVVDVHPEPLSIDGHPVMIDDESDFGPAIYREGHVVLH